MKQLTWRDGVKNSIAKAEGRGIISIATGSAACWRRAGMAEVEAYSIMPL